jgi:hypothetical protein
MTEPIAFYDPHKGFYWAKPTKITAPVTVDVEPLSLYAERTWVGLTDKDWNRSKHNYDFQKGVDWAESILKEKNT